MNPAQCDEALLILYEEKLFFILGVAIIRPSTLLGDENMSDGKFIPHLLKEKTACHNSLVLMQAHSVTAVAIKHPQKRRPFPPQSISCSLSPSPQWFIDLAAHVHCLRLLSKATDTHSPRKFPAAVKMGLFVVLNKLHI